MGVSLLGLSAWYLTPISDYIVDIMLWQVPIQADMELGRKAMKEFPHSTIHHPKWTPMVKSVGWELVSSSSQAVDENSKYYSWDFGIIDHGTMVNAFALPGGVVRVTLALLEQLDLTEGELAALLGHEMGHVLCRHSQARVLQRQVVSMIFQALTYQDNDAYQESFGEAIGELLLKSADWVGQQAFSRKDEYQADAMGWELLKHSKRYNPQSLQSVLTKLWDLQGRQGGTTSWESTHPGTLDRIDALDHKWKELPFVERRLLERNTVS
jgi:predicted Zn-dependent protease